MLSQTTSLSKDGKRETVRSTAKQNGIQGHQWLRHWAMLPTVFNHWLKWSCGLQASSLTGSTYFIQGFPYKNAIRFRSNPILQQHFTLWKSKMNSKLTILFRQSRQTFSLARFRNEWSERRMGVRETMTWILKWNKMTRSQWVKCGNEHADSELPPTISDRRIYDLSFWPFWWQTTSPLDHLRLNWVFSKKYNIAYICCS